MDKRYQIFVSSTYADLQEERQRVLQTLMEMDCIPAGMELFPAADEEQWEFIKRVINDCDYYLLVIGGRYGSLTAEGISYTEKEYDYAVERGLKVIALIHGDPEAIPAGKSEAAPELREKLREFRDKVSTGRLVKFWTQAGELPGLVALSLTKTIKAYPAVGWVRANMIASTELLEDVNQLRKRNEQLMAELREAQRDRLAEAGNLAQGDDEFQISGTYKEKLKYGPVTKTWSVTLTWNQIFSYIGPHIIGGLNELSANSTFARILFNTTKLSGESPGIEGELYQTVKLHLVALGLVTVRRAAATQGGTALFWNLTPRGNAHLLRLRSVKRDSAQEE